MNARTGGELPLEGLSKHNYNAVLYYERGGFGARLAYNYRSSFPLGISAGGEGSFVEPIGQLDAGLRYTLNDKITFTFEATNLNDFEQVQYTGVPEARNLFAKHGRRDNPGVIARF